jgi:hypothetical protein
MPGKKTAKKSTSATSKTARSSGNGSARHGSKDAIDLLTAQHKAINEVAQKLQKFKSDTAGVKELRNLCRLWTHHRVMEEEMVYPAFRDKGVDEARIDEAGITHDLVAILLADLVRRDPADGLLAPGVKVLLRMISEVIEGKEQRKGLFSAAKEAGVDMQALGEKLQARLSEEDAEEDGPGDLLPRYLSGAAFRHRPRERGLQRLERNHEMDERRSMRDRYEDDDERDIRRSNRRDYDERDDVSRYRGEGEHRRYSGGLAGPRDDYERRGEVPSRGRDFGRDERRGGHDDFFRQGAGEDERRTYHSSRSEDDYERDERSSEDDDYGMRSRGWRRR